MINIKDYPKSYKALGEFVRGFARKIQDMFIAELGSDAASVEIPEMSDFEISNMLDSMLKINTRSLYDFFDEKGIEIEIYRGWKYNVDGESDDEFNSRIECEEGAFNHAFKLLEEKL